MRTWDVLSTTVHYSFDNDYIVGSSPIHKIVSKRRRERSAANFCLRVFMSSLKGNDLIYSFAAFFSTVFMLLVYNCWPGSAARKLSILFLAVVLTTIYWLVNYHTNGIDFREKLSALTSLSLFTGCVFALWLRAE